MENSFCYRGKSRRRDDIAIENVIANYLLFLIAFQPLEEYYNCTHPNTTSELVHFVCTWEEDDFIQIGKRWVLKRERDTDNKYEAWGRNQYWKRKEKVNGKSH